MNLPKLKPIAVYRDEKLIHSTLKKVNDAYEIEQLLKENSVFDKQYAYSRITEIKQCIYFGAQMLFAFPIGLIMRKIIRKNKRLNYILQFPALQCTRNNIEKGSFAYDTLLFKHLPHQIIANKSHLANLVCLSLMFGDEFIDGIAIAYGKENINELFSNKKYNFNLQFKKESTQYELYYEFDICKILPTEILEKINTKYAINYKQFYEHLLFLLAEMNKQLKKLPTDIADKAAQTICTACNKCFETYKADVQDFLIDYDWNKLIHYVQSKDNDIVITLLQLRGVLLKKDLPKYQQHYSSWGYILRSMQIYDDLQDIAIDCDFQMNFLAFFSKTFFKNEWLWLQQNKAWLQQQKTLIVQQQIALNMSQSMMLCLQYNKNVSIKNFNWVQQKIVNYLWRKNWLGIKNKDIIKTNFDITIQEIGSKIFTNKHTMISTEMKYAHVLDASLLYPILREKIFKLLNKSQTYQLKNYYTTLPISTKATMAKFLLQKL